MATAMLSVVGSLLRDTPIVVTGLGVFSAAGTTVGDLWTSALKARSPAQWRAPFAVCTAPEYRAAARADRVVQLALAAARQAWDDARLSTTPLPPCRLGVIAGTSRGPVGKWTESVRERVLPTHAANCTIASLSGALSVHFKTHGPCFTVSATCASSANAIALGAEQILLGHADAVLAGGADASLDPTILAQLQAAGVLGSHLDPAQTCRPFAKDRNGTVLGEAGAFLVLESAVSAQRRGAKMHARLAGWSVAGEGHQRAGISETAHGLRQVITDALACSGFVPEQIGYVNAHGTGTRLNDAQEAKALRHIFPRGVPCSSTKPVTGHCMGASAALETVISIAALQHQQLPPTANCLPLDPDCALDIIHTAPRPTRTRVALSNSSGFWGHNAALVFTKDEP
jgi:3-oxoacyl-[acyl-carrier-protein] synthase II